MNHRLLFSVLPILCFSACNNLFYDEVEEARFTGNPGIRQSFEVVETFEDVIGFAGENAELLSISARGVESDGTINLKAKYNPKPQVHYRFVRPYQSTYPRKKKEEITKMGTGKRNLDEPIPITHSPYENIDITIHFVQRGSSGAGEDMWRSRPSPSDTISLTIKPPICSFESIWKQALELGAMENAVAEINYDLTGYQFTIIDKMIIEHKDVSETIFYMHLDEACKVIDHKNKTVQ